jgi:hypothetical protein
MVPSPTDDPAIQHVVVNKFKFIGGQAIYKECQRTVAYQAYEYMATEFGETVDMSQQFKIMYQLYHFGRPCAEAGGKVYREIQDPVPYKQMFLEGLGPYKFLFNRDCISNVTDPDSPSNRNIQSLILSIRPEFHRKDGLYIQVRDQLVPAGGSSKPQAQHINWDLMSRKAFSNKANALGQPLLDMAKLAAKNVRKMASIILSSNSPYKKSAESGQFESGKNWDDYVSWVLKEARKELVDDTEHLSVLDEGEVGNDRDDWIFPGFWALLLWGPIPPLGDSSHDFKSSLWQSNPGSDAGQKKQAGRAAIRKRRAEEEAYARENAPPAAKRGVVVSRSDVVADALVVITKQREQQDQRQTMMQVLMHGSSLRKTQVIRMKARLDRMLLLLKELQDDKAQRTDLIMKIGDLEEKLEIAEEEDAREDSQELDTLKNTILTSQPVVGSSNSTVSSSLGTNPHLTTPILPRRLQPTTEVQPTDDIQNSPSTESEQLNSPTESEDPDWCCSGCDICKLVPETAMDNQCLICSLLMHKECGLDYYNNDDKLDKLFPNIGDNCLLEELYGRHICGLCIVKGEMRIEFQKRREAKALAIRIEVASDQPPSTKN